MLNFNWMTRPSFAVAYLTCFFNWRLKALDRSLHKQTCQWDMLDRTHAGRHAGKSIGKHNWSRRQQIFTGSCTGKSFFFSWLKRDFSYLIFVCHDQKYIRKTSHSWKKYICMLSLKVQTGKRTVTGMCIFSLICAKTVNKKTILSMHYICYT